MLIKFSELQKNRFNNKKFINELITTIVEKFPLPWNIKENNNELKLEDIVRY